MRRLPLVIVIALVLPLLSVPVARADDPPGDPAFHRTWSRTDYPIKNGNVSRTWMWGEKANTPFQVEPYDEAPGGQRLVVYFDKSRMEVSNPSGDPNSIWYVTNGLLVLELINGRLQVGDARFATRAPAQIPVAGDRDDQNGPTYATFRTLLTAPPLADSTVITQRVNRAGQVTQDNALASFNVEATKFVPETNHRIAQPFWRFMNSSGLVYEDHQFVNANLFVNPFYATGFPVTEAYWTTVLVGGTAHDVLMQCFERRCLTYTPQNPEVWQVEAGNVGLHYHEWRYENDDRPTPVEPLPVEGNVFYQPDMSTLPPFDDGTARMYFDASVDAFVLENNYLAGQSWSAVFVYWAPTSQVLDYSLSVDIVQLTTSASSFSQAAVWTRYGPVDDSNTVTQAALTGVDTNGYVGSWYLGATAERLHDYDQAPAFNVGYLAVNNLKVIVSFGHGWVFVNDVFMHEFDLPAGANTDVDGFALALYNLTEDVSAGKIGFRNLTVRALQPAAASTENPRGEDPPALQLMPVHGVRSSRR